MKNYLAVAIALAIVTLPAVSTCASAQQRTREEVRQELIQSINDGARYVTDTSYPVVSPMYEREIEKLRQANHAALDTRASSPNAAQGESAPEPCVGPASFCNVYFGG
ncbi:DUF4148 domain-containing protein [Burkholderia ubonensis]|uniref:DUF4148 domain-containing protein n=1 Tax=Burkholderia ubonensis TaxID=101571 RepID=UPI0009B3682F|nr:DUF4148 domain-containing protein [Burkholderia ubonensis]